MLIVIREIWASIHTVRSTITENVPEGRKEAAEATTTGEKKEANRSGGRRRGEKKGDWSRQKLVHLSYTHCGGTLLLF